MGVVPVPRAFETFLDATTKQVEKKEELQA